MQAFIRLALFDVTIDVCGNQFSTCIKHCLSLCMWVWVLDLLNSLREFSQGVCLTKFEFLLQHILCLEPIYRARDSEGQTLNDASANYT